MSPLLQNAVVILLDLLWRSMVTMTANSQPPGQPPGQPPALLDSHHHSQPLDLTGQPLVDNSMCYDLPLPSFQPMASPQFYWGLNEPSVVIQSLEPAYDETIYWRRNSFTVHNGSASKCFVLGYFVPWAMALPWSVVLLRQLVFCYYRSHLSHQKIRTMPLIWNADYQSDRIVISLNLSQRAVLFNSICPSAQICIPTFN